MRNLMARDDLPSEMAAKASQFAWRTLFGLAATLFVIRAAYHNSGQLVWFTAAIVSLVAMNYFSLVKEKDPRGRGRWMIRPTRNFLGFMIGDGLLVFAFSALGDAFSHNDLGFFQGWVWWAICIVVMAFVAFVWDFNERPENSAWTLLQYYSPTKIIHDYLTLPALVFMGVYGAPAFFSCSITTQIEVVVLVGLWAFLALVYDRFHFRSLAHPVYDWANGEAYLCPTQEAAEAQQDELFEQYEDDPDDG